MTASLLVAALAMGFFGSPHCLGMCGGIVAAFGISMKNLSPAKRKTLIATYHIGRLMSYMALGTLATIVGSSVIAPFLTDNALPRILLGLALIFAALLMLGVPFLNRLEKLGLGLWNKLAPVRQKVLPIDSTPKALAAGLLWGLLPCGLVYGAHYPNPRIDWTLLYLKDYRFKHYNFKVVIFWSTVLLVNLVNIV